MKLAVEFEDETDEVKARMTEALKWVNEELDVVDLFGQIQLASFASEPIKPRFKRDA